MQSGVGVGTLALGYGKDDQRGWRGGGQILAKWSYVSNEQPLDVSSC